MFLRTYGCHLLAVLCFICVCSNILLTNKFYIDQSVFVLYFSITKWYTYIYVKLLYKVEKLVDTAKFRQI